MSITLAHWIYCIMVLVILGFMLARKETIIPCIVGVFLIGLVAKGSISGATRAIFDSFIVAGIELISVIMIISVIVAMARLLEEIGANYLMAAPIAKIVKSPDAAFFMIGIVMLLVSWFFWPSPATAMIGAVLLPVAIRVGLPVIGFAVAMNIFGHGIGLSTDFIIQGAPTITATSGGVPVVDVMYEGIPLYAVMAVVTVIASYIILKRDMKTGNIIKPQVEVYNVEDSIKYPKIAKWTAIIVPILFLLDIIAMFAFKLVGGDATALVGGTAAIVLCVLCVVIYKKEALEKIAEYIKKGFSFGMEIFGPILPIAGFFYLGEVGPFTTVFGNVLPKGSAGILSDMGLLLASSVALNKPIAAVMETIVGVITGLDGSGFSGMNLAGSIAKVFGTALNVSIAKLCALGQIAAIWTGGGTIIPWAVIPVAAITGIRPMDIARKNLIPVIIGFVVTTIVAMFIL